MGFLKRTAKYFKDDAAKIVCERTGWSKPQAYAHMVKASKYGITEKEYLRRFAYDLEDEELAQLMDVVDGIWTFRRADEKFYADRIREMAGWDEETCAAKLKKSKSLGISNMRYAQNGYWLKSDEEIEEIAAAYKEAAEDVREGKQNYLRLIMDKTGWKYGKAEFEVMKARAAQGASYEDFYRFRFYDRTPEDRLRFPTLRVMDRFRCKYVEYGPRARYFDDKAEFNRTFADKIHRVWFTNEGLTYEKFKDLIAPLDYVMIKPITDSCGNGISKHACSVSESEDRKLYDLIMAQQDILVEECVKQHEDMAKLCDTSVNTIRINTMQWNGECVFQFAIVRTGCGDIIDNFHNGGIAARVDVETGVVNADAVDLDGNIYETNPYSGVRLRGYQIPHWDMILDTCREISGRVKGVDYVGWDFAITPDGIDLIEGNEGAYVMPQMCNLQDDVGLRPVLVDPYMKF